MTAVPLLELCNLKTRFSTEAGELVAVDDVSFAVLPGAAVGVVGESGCGKSVMALSVMRLVPEPGKVVFGRVLFRGEDLLKASEPRMRAVRGNRIAIVFQEPMSSLNPVFTAGDQIAEAVRLHRGLDRAAARRRAIELLAQVGVAAPERRVDAYPHELSGGMRQRVLIAMALASDPELLIADEPTTALDVTIQAQILELLRRLQRERQMALMLITHDLGVVAEACDEVVVMYAGRVVERASVAALFAHPAHPYTAGLLRSIPSLEGGGGRLEVIPGVVPSLLRLPPGCSFRARCERAIAACDQVAPVLEPKGEGQQAACHCPVPAE